MRSWTIAFVCGICLSCLLPDNLPLLPAIFMVVTGCAGQLYPSGRIAAAFLLGAGWFLLHAAVHNLSLLPTELEQQELLVQAEIASMPEQRINSQRFNIRIRTYCVVDQDQCEDSRQVNWKALVNVYHPLQVEPGQVWQMLVKLKRPRGLANPGLFDYEAWLYQQGYQATGYIRSSIQNRLLDSGLVLIKPEYLRFMLTKNMATTAASEQGNYRFKHLNLIKALSLGDRNSITKREWELFSFTGTNHLVVISGLHVGLVSLMVYRCFTLLLGCVFPCLFKYIPARRLGALSGALAAVFYAMLSGFALPAQRACIMGMVFCLAWLCVRHTRPEQNLCLALLSILFLDPAAPLNTGFWLSFFAVAVLVLLLSRPGKDLLIGKQTPLKLKCWRIIRTQCLLTLALLPLLLYFFMQASLLAPLVNLLAIPYISFLVVPLSLAGTLTLLISPTLAFLLLALADRFMGIFIAILELVRSTFSWSYFSFPLPSLDMIPVFPDLLLYLLLLMTILVTVKYFSKLVSGIVIVVSLLIILVFSGTPKMPDYGDLDITVLDVGQGMAVIVRTNNHVLVYDTGPRYSENFDSGRDLLAPFLLRHKITSIDALVISHTDNDHAGGMAGLLEIIKSTRLYQPGNSDSAGNQHCGNTVPWQWDGVLFSFIHPTTGFNQLATDNNRSCVLRISAGEFSIVLPGDIENQAEQHLVNTLPDLLPATVLLSPHHGSQTSSSREFLQAVNPQLVIISSAYMNRFNHPHPQVLERYHQSGIQVVNTADSGAVDFRISRQLGLINLSSYRQSHPRIWR